MARHFSMIRNFHLADLFTLANGACGAAAIFLSMRIAAGDGVEKVWAAGALIVAALFFDVADGRVARWRHKASAMGKELDSLSDVISFGVAPASLAFSLGLQGGLDIAVLLYFVCCGISRLARYNVTADEIAAETGKVTYFEGTPIPSSVLLVGLLVWLASTGRIGEAFLGGAVSVLGVQLHPIVLVFALSGSLMISKTIRIPKP